MRRLILAKCWLRRHVAAFHHSYEYGHLVYFTLVALHGPYYLAAGGLVLLGAAALLFAED